MSFSPLPTPVSDSNVDSGDNSQAPSITACSMDILDYIVKSTEAETDEKLYTLLEQTLKELCGYDRVLFSLMSDHASLQLKAGHGIMRNYPDDWMGHYVASGYEHVDPVRRFGFSRVGPFIWDSLPLVTKLTKHQTICMDECKAAGFYNGAALCLRGITSELGGIGVASSSQKHPDTELESKHKLGLLNVIAQQFYTKFCDLHNKPQKTLIEEISLTGREIQVLHGMAAGKKDATIADDLKVSVHAVDFHVRNILQKLKSNNRHAAVMRAVNSGLIPLEAATFIFRTTQR